MPDESTYGFAKPDALELIQLIGNGDREFPEVRPRGRRGGSSGGYLLFQYDEEYYQYDDSGLCSEQVAVTRDSLRARVTAYPCGSTSAAGVTGGYVDDLYDDMGWLVGQSIRTVAGKYGVAHRFADPAGYECRWVITSLNLFTQIQVVEDHLYQEEGPLIKRKMVGVYGECDLPDELVEVYDCDEQYYGGA